MFAFMSADAEYVRANFSRCSHDLFLSPSYQSDALCVVERGNLDAITVNIA